MSLDLKAVILPSIATEIAEINQNSLSFLDHESRKSVLLKQPGNIIKN